MQLRSNLDLVYLRKDLLSNYFGYQIFNDFLNQYVLVMIINTFFGTAGLF